MKAKLNLQKIGRNISIRLGKTGILLKNKSPEILYAVSAAASIGAIVSACKATLDTSDILEESSATIEEIKNQEEVDKKELTKAYISTGAKIVKAYAPAALLETSALCGFNGTRRIYKSRYTNAVASAVALDSALKEYRKNVVAKYGEDVDKQMRYGIEKVDIKEVVTDENGKSKTVKKTVDAVNNLDYSQYARFFDESCGEWTKSSEYNFSYLKCREAQANELLQRRGYVFLNEVYQMLGILPTKAGQSVGWVYDPENPVGDNYISFGITDIWRPRTRDFINGYENVILLDFNVDGNILDILN